MVLHSAGTGAELDTETVIKLVFTKSCLDFNIGIWKGLTNQQPGSSCDTLSFNILLDLLESESSKHTTQLGDWVSHTLLTVKLEVKYGDGKGTNPKGLIRSQVNAFRSQFEMNDGTEVKEPGVKILPKPCAVCETTGHHI